MTLRIILLATVGWLLAAVTAAAQVEPWRPPPGNPPAPGPDQPIYPRAPALERRPAPPSPPPAPFQLTREEEAQVDHILNVWEQRSAGVKTFECNFKRWVWDLVFGSPNKAKFEDIGSVKYAAPDKGAFKIEGERAEYWICDGKSIYEYNYQKKQLIEHKLPAELQGKAIADGPLPFIFGARAQQLRQRYFVRVVTPPEVQGQQTWLEVFPRFQKDAANFKRVELILTNQNMTPFAIRLYEPNGKNYTSYQFYEVVTNDPLRIFKGDPFVARTPFGWQKIVEEPPAAQTGRVPPAGVRK